MRHGRRFHDPDATALLEDMFFDLDALAHESGQPHIRIVGPSEGVMRLYRARQAESLDQADTFGRDPSVHLAPPPANKRKGGRLNAPGISVFYGAFNPETCIAEIRPPVGSHVVVAAFEPTRELKLLDLTAFSTAPSNGSLFDDGYLETVRRWRFLRTFHSIVSAPVVPQDEALGYVPTQVVAEYLANVAGFDGIIFASAQTGGAPVPEDEVEDEPTPPLERCNVALFNAEKCLALPSPDERSGSAAPSFDTVLSDHAVFRFDRREPARRAGSLRYVEGTAEVHSVLAVSYRTFAEPPRPPPLVLDNSEPDF